MKLLHHRQHLVMVFGVILEFFKVRRKYFIFRQQFPELAVETAICFLQYLSAQGSEK